MGFINTAVVAASLKLNQWATSSPCVEDVRHVFTEPIPTAYADVERDPTEQFLFAPLLRAREKAAEAGVALTKADLDILEAQQ